MIIINNNELLHTLLGNIQSVYKKTYIKRPGIVRLVGL
jgi:hypothetical protein